MVSIVAPRRGEPIVAPNGVPTIRFFEYLEATATQSNETVSDTEIGNRLKGMTDGMPIIQNIS